MDNLIISQGSLLASGATRPAIPGTPGGSRPASTRSTGVGGGSGMLVTASNSPSRIRTPAAVTRAIRQSNSELIRANRPERYQGPTPKPMATNAGPSTFLRQALGGQLPMSWLTGRA